MTRGKKKQSISDQLSNLLSATPTGTVNADDEDVSPMVFCCCTVSPTQSSSACPPSALIANPTSVLNFLENVRADVDPESGFESRITRRTDDDFLEDDVLDEVQQPGSSR